MLAVSMKARSDSGRVLSCVLRFSGLSRLRVVRKSELKVCLGNHAATAGKQPVRVIIAHGNVRQSDFNELGVGSNTSALFGPGYQSFRHSPTHHLSPLALQ